MQSDTSYEPSPGDAFWWALSSIRGIGPKQLSAVARRLTARGLSGSNFLGADPVELEKLGLPKSALERAVELLGNGIDVPPPPRGSRLITPDDADYPHHRLSENPPPPPILYCCGNTALLAVPAIAISGSRTAPPEALQAAREIARKAVSRGINVVSGHAAGVDHAAHSGALGSGGTTTAVLANGLLTFRSKSLPEFSSEEDFLVVSEFEPSAEWTPHRAMARNRTIASLSDSVVVVAANRQTGGSWAQAELALRTGKTLFVPDFPEELVPGNRPLIELGARAVDLEHLDDIFDQAEEPSSAADQLDFGDL